MQIKYITSFFLSLIMLEITSYASDIKDSVSIGFDTYFDNGDVQVYSPTLSVLKKLSTSFFVNAKLRIDGISAASIQALTSASTATTTSGDDGEGEEDGIFEFDDVRYAPTLSVGYDDSINSATLGIYFSTEADYQGKALFGSYIRQFNEQNTAVGISFSQSDDKWEPQITREMPQDYRKETKVDFSINQLISPTMSMQVVYSYMYSEGFLADPYHSVPKPTPTNLTDPKAYELYPSERTGHAFALKGVSMLNESNSINLSYRYYFDDWDISSNTVNAEWLHDFSKHSVSGLRVRYYSQTEANFTRPIDSYTIADAGSLVAVDYKMTAFDSYTIGIPFIYTKDNGDKVTASIDYYQTTSNDNIKYWYNVDSLSAVFTTLTYQFNY